MNTIIIIYIFGVLFAGGFTISMIRRLDVDVDFFNTLKVIISCIAWPIHLGLIAANIALALESIANSVEEYGEILEIEIKRIGGDKT